MLLPFPGFSASVEGDGLSYALPWVAIEAELAGDDRPVMEKGLGDVLAGRFGTEDAQSFLKRLQGYSVAYFAPRRDLDRSVLDSSPPEDAAAAAVLGDPARLLAALPLDPRPSVERWVWDLREIEDASRAAPDVYDPLSVVSYLIGKRLEYEALTDPYRLCIEKKLEKLRTFSEKSFFEAMKRMLRLTHYVTASVGPALQAALERYPHLRGPLSEFIAEERGHDELMARSLAFLGVEAPAQVPLLPSAVAQMAMFQTIAVTSPLALTCCIGLFEGSFYPESDPYGKLLEGSSNPQAAFGYKAHFAINAEHDHKDEIFAFARALAPLDARTLAYGVRLFELMTRMTQLIDIELNQVIDAEVIGVIGVRA